MSYHLFSIWNGHSPVKFCFWSSWKENSKNIHPLQRLYLSALQCFFFSMYGELDVICFSWKESISFYSNYGKENVTHYKQKGAERGSLEGREGLQTIITLALQPSLSFSSPSNTWTNQGPQILLSPGHFLPSTTDNFTFSLFPKSNENCLTFKPLPSFFTELFTRRAGLGM